MDWMQIILILIMFVLIIIPIGKYLFQVIAGEKSPVDKVMDKVDNLIYKVAGITKEDMSWKQYIISFLICNIVMMALAIIILAIQVIPLLNPDGIKSLSPSLIINTAVSFITNTNLQHYAGESSLSHLSQMMVIIFLMFVSGASGVAVGGAFMRGISGRQKTAGNFYVDLVRVTTRVLVPFSLVIALFLVAQGVPQTLKGTITVKTMEGTYQDIARGPVAALEAIKHLGTNGGGFFGANSSHPFENPTPISNIIEMLSMMLIPGALVVSFGHMLNKKRQAWAIFVVMAALFLMVLPMAYYAEKAGNPMLSSMGISQEFGNMEGKEVRLGIAQSSLFTTVTTAFTTGSVNNMHDSLTPLGGFVPLWNMMLNVVFGGEGVGFMNMIMYAILTVFLCGLMVGRTPEFLGKKLESREIKLIAITILIHPLIILLPSAVALISPAGASGITNGGFHGLSQVVYEFTSSAANNGSGFEGLLDNTLFWNSSTAVVMYLGRYISMVLLLMVASYLAAKKPVAQSTGTFRTDNAMFTIILIFIVLIIGALTFLPTLVLGPIAEFLTL